MDKSTNCDNCPASIWRYDETCSYCGGLNPTRIFELIDEGAELEPTDKAYKVYIRHQGKTQKGYFYHFDEAQAIEFVIRLYRGTLKIGYPGRFYSGIGFKRHEAAIDAALIAAGLRTAEEIKTAKQAEIDKKRQQDIREAERNVEQLRAALERAEGRIADLAMGRDKKVIAPDKPTVVCLCGSTRFGDAFRAANLRETIAGRITLSIGCDTKSDADLVALGELTEEAKAKLDELHKRKIDIADEILVLNVGGYIGESTRSEILYAMEHGKDVRWLEAPSSQILEDLGFRKD